MTVLQFQRDMAEEIGEILSGMLFKDLLGELKSMTTFCQSLPKRDQSVKEQHVRIDALIGEEEEPKDGKDPYPYCVVRAESGNIRDGVQKMRVLLTIGIFNDDALNMGHEELINVIHRISDRFVRNPILADKYQMDEKAGISWILDDEDRYPYFIGGLEMTWDTFFAGREDRYV